MTSDVVLICICLMISNVEYLFMYLWLLYVFFGKMSFHILYPYLNWVVFAVELYEFFIHFGS